MSIQTASYDTIRMERFIRRRINALELETQTDSYGNIYVTKGKADLYPTMVCHIDTVHEVNTNVQVFKTKDKMFAMDMHNMEQYGIGGDDKVGIYITLQLLEKFKNFKAVFFKDEEVGCQGSSIANFEFFNDSTIVLQCDRKGNTDIVNNIGGYSMYDETLNKDITAILQHYGRVEVTGGMTDVQEIARNNSVQVANMSCGYYNPHSEQEYIDINDVYETTNLCYQILNATKHKRYEIKRTKPVYNTAFYPKTAYNYNKHFYKHDMTAYKSEAAEKICYCGQCGSETIYDEFETAGYCELCMSYTYIDVPSEYNYNKHNIQSYEEL